MKIYKNLPIRKWAIEDRPREKMIQRGMESLTDAELIAIMLGTGTREMSAIDLARHLLKEFGDLNRLARAGVRELTRIKGIGQAKAISLVSAFEIGRRKVEFMPQEDKFRTSEDIVRYLSPKIRDHNQEVFYVLFLNRNNVLLGERKIFTGGLHATIIDPKIVFREAVHFLACNIVIAHNHPSGNLKPSKSDLDVTRILKEAGKLMDIRLLDHVIISHRGHYSFADHELME